MPMFNVVMVMINHGTSFRYVVVVINGNMNLWLMAHWSLLMSDIDLIRVNYICERALNPLAFFFSAITIEHKRKIIIP